MAHKVDCKWHERIDYDGIALCRIGRFGGLVSDSMCTRCPCNKNNKLTIDKPRNFDQTPKPDRFFKPLLDKRAYKMAQAIDRRKSRCTQKDCDK